MPVRRRRVLRPAQQADRRTVSFVFFVAFVVETVTGRRRAIADLKFTSSG
jgi:hypothetical protein